MGVLTAQGTMMSNWTISDQPRLRGRALQKRTRRVIRRDGGICHICGQSGADVADHVLALARGGADDESNIKAAHSTCNARKAVTIDRRPPRRRQPEAHPGEVLRG